MNETIFIEVKQSPALRGEVIVEGAKNALLPIVPAALLASGTSVIHNACCFDDMYSMIKLLEAYNVSCLLCKNTKTLELETSQVINSVVAPSLFSAYRASTLFAGALLGRFGEAWIGMPGGDQIGKRPIDLHVYAFKQCGVTVEHHEHYLHLHARKLHPGKIVFDYPSVGATQNILLLAACIEGTTVIKNAAQEPEIFDLIKVLQNMGAKIETEFGGTIYITGTKHLKPFQHSIMEDRLEAATFLMMGAITGGEVSIPNAPNYCMDVFFKKLTDMGHSLRLHSENKGVTLTAGKKIFPTKIKTIPYPGFATDLQSPIMALLAVTPGQSHIHETVFESRMKHAYELNKMGAQIRVEYDCAHIEGVNTLQGTVVHANDIRAGAALVLAGLVAQGTTHIFGVHHLLRGYYALDAKVQALGGHMYIVPHVDIFTQENTLQKANSL